MVGMRLEKRILIVDDDDPIRALLMTVLRRRGFHADCARNGVEALQLLAACRYSLVVLDLMMPRMNGYEVLDHIGKMPPATRPLVLVLTAGLGQRSFETVECSGFALLSADGRGGDGDRAGGEEDSCRR